MRAIAYHRIRAVSFVAGPMVVALLDAAPVHAHGWHNAALTTSSLEEWLGDVQRVIPDILKRANETELRAGRGLDDLKKKPGTTQNQPSDPDYLPITHRLMHVLAERARWNASVTEARRLARDLGAGAPATGRAA